MYLKSLNFLYSEEDDFLKDRGKHRSLSKTAALKLQSAQESPKKLVLSVYS